MTPHVPTTAFSLHAFRALYTTEAVYLSYHLSPSHGRFSRFFSIHSRANSIPHSWAKSVVRKVLLVVIIVARPNLLSQWTSTIAVINIVAGSNAVVISTRRLCSSISSVPCSRCSSNLAARLVSNQLLKAIRYEPGSKVFRTRYVGWQ